jgi:signal transduction histidine kinase
MMEVVAWGLVVVLLGIVVWLAVREPANPYPEAMARLRSELDSGAEVGPARADEPPEIQELRSAMGRILAPEELKGEEEDPEGRVLNGVLRYLGVAVLPALADARATSSFEALQDAIDALDDLAFYAADPSEEGPVRQNLDHLVQAVTREYAMETRVPVKVIGPERPVHLAVASEAFKDVLYLILSNAGRFGGGKTVEVTVDGGPEQVRVRVGDRGKGFSPEALDRAFDPFWTSDRDALGLGLTHARRLARRIGGELEIRNREGGGAEVELRLPAGHPPSA